MLSDMVNDKQVSNMTAFLIFIMVCAFIYGYVKGENKPK